MKTTGKEVINAIVRRLNDKDIRCDDSAIVTELRELNELNELIEKNSCEHKNSSWDHDIGRFVCDDCNEKCN